jgi:DNA-binding transcriptional LysR family regulator
MLELRLLRYFVAVAETEHVGRAAERLHVSQSPLSRQIRQLEELLGVPLFAREGRCIRLTESGRALLAPARDLLARADALVRDARTATRPSRIAVGFVSTALATGVLPAALGALRERHADVQIALRHAATHVQLALVRAGELDVALVHSAGSSRDLRATRVLEQPYRLAVARGPLARTPLDRRMLGDLPWIAVLPEQRSRARWLATCAAAGFEPHIAVEVADYASALALVEAGLGVTALPASQARSVPPGVVMRTLPVNLTAELWVVRAAHAPPLVEELARLAGRS